MQSKQSARTRVQPPRQLPPWLILVIDILLTAVALVVFAIFDHVIPHYEQQAVYTPPTAQRASYGAPDAASALAGAPADGDATADPQAGETAGDSAVSQAELSAQQAAVGDFSAKFADKFTSGEVIQTDTSYRSANLNITIRKETTRFDEYDETYFVQDIYIRNIDCLRTIFARDTFGRSVTENVVPMSERANAVCAINSDFYSHGSAGIVVRNGVLYRREPQLDEEVLVLYRSGDMQVFQNGASIDVDQLMADGAWQVFSFGPSLLTEDGALRESYARVHHDPRTIIGMIEPGHYLFIVVDGRQGSYSKGMTYSQSARLAQQLGCAVAYNLDGGKTTQMLYRHQLVNHPYEGGRRTSDLICIVDIAQ